MTLIPKKSISKYKVNHNIFQEESERSFYLAGFIAADGCIRITGNKKNKYINHRLQISLSKNDEEYLILIRDCLESTHPIANYLIENSKRNSNWNDVWESKLMITSKKMVEDLQKFNVVPRKSLIYTFPEWLIEHPFVNHFMRGYFDGDGSFFINSESSNNRLCCSIRGTENFLQVYKKILQNKCDFECKDNIDRSNRTPQLRFKGEFSMKIFDFLYEDATIYLERKYNVRGKL